MIEKGNSISVNTLSAYKIMGSPNCNVEIHTKYFYIVSKRPSNYTH